MERTVIVTAIAAMCAAILRGHFSRIVVRMKQFFVPLPYPLGTYQESSL